MRVAELSAAQHSQPFLWWLSHLLPVYSLMCEPLSYPKISGRALKRFLRTHQGNADQELTFFRLQIRRRKVRRRLAPSQQGGPSLWMTQVV